MNVEKQITSIEQTSAIVTIVDQGGNAYPGMPIGGTLEFTSDNPEVSSPAVETGGLSAKLNSGKNGIATITGKHGGTLAEFEDHTWKVEVVNASTQSSTASFGPTVTEIPATPPIE